MMSNCRGTIPSTTTISQMNPRLNQGAKGGARIKEVKGGSINN
jgi:hypothetical protein